MLLSPGKQEESILFIDFHAFKLTEVASGLKCELWEKRPTESDLCGQSAESAHPRDLVYPILMCLFALVFANKFFLIFAFLIFSSVSWTEVSRTRRELFLIHYKNTSTLITALGRGRSESNVGLC